MLQANRDQRRAIEADLKPIYIIAGAGTGKTKTVTLRIKHLFSLGFDPDRILAITFTNNSSRELKHRIAAINNDKELKHVYTFHAFFKYILDEDSHLVDQRFKDYRIISEEGARWVIRKVLKDLKLDDSKKSMDTRRLENHFSRLRRLERKEKEFNRELNNLPKIDGFDKEEIWRKIYDNYCDFLAEKGFLEFIDLEIKVDELLDTNDDFRIKWSSKFDAIFVDEFQDTSKYHFEILKKITHEDFNVFLVGDPDQKIYGFREIIGDSEKEFKNYYKNGEILRLEQNYRSTKPILETANKLISMNHLFLEIAKKLWTEKGGGKKVLYKRFPDPRSEKSWVVGRIEELKKEGVPLNEIAILARTNQILREFYGFIREKHNWDINIVWRLGLEDNEGLFFIMAVLFLLITDEVSICYLHDILTFIEKFHGDYREICWVDMEAFQDFSRRNNYTFTRTIEDLDELELTEETREAFRKFGYTILKLREGKDEEIISWVDSILHEFKCKLHPLPKIQKSINHIEKFIRQHRMKYWKLRNEEMVINLLAKEEEEVRLTNPNTLNLNTIHKAKGLEYKYVFLVRMNEGILPSDRPDSVMMEERRLTYVAYTRAKEMLYLTHSPDLWNKKLDESRFIKESKDPLYFEESGEE